MLQNLPTQAEIVIIGGGIVGCSIAYHLSSMGKTDVLLLEKSGLTHGATWHAAGVIGQLRPSRNVTRMLGLTVALYDALEEETGQAIDWKRVGSLRIASSKDRMLEYKRAATTAKSFGLDMHLLGPKETQALFPIMSLDGVEGSAYIPSDGYVDPASATQALAIGARRRGVMIVEGVETTGFSLAGRRVREVHHRRPRACRDRGQRRGHVEPRACGHGRRPGADGRAGAPVHCHRADSRLAAWHADGARP